MNQETTFVLSYSTGQYEEHSVTIIAVMNDGVKANELCDKFNKISKFYYNEYDIARDKASAMRAARNQVLENSANSFWDSIRAKMPDNLKDCIALYPVRETESPDFSVEEVPIWE